MTIEIPEELLHPTLEELDEKTQLDLKRKWRFRKRLGKRERVLAKQEKETAKLKSATVSAAQPEIGLKPLSNLFATKVKTVFSLAAANAAANAASTANSASPPLNPTMPTLRVGLPPQELAPPQRKRGRPPKVKPI